MLTSQLLALFRIKTNKEESGWRTKTLASKALSKTMLIEGCIHKDEASLSTTRSHQSMYDARFELVTRDLPRYSRVATGAPVFKEMRGVGGARENRSRGIQTQPRVSKQLGDDADVITAAAPATADIASAAAAAAAAASASAVNVAEKRLVPVGNLLHANLQPSIGVEAQMKVRHLTQYRYPRGGVTHGQTRTEVLGVLNLSAFARVWGRGV